MSIIKYIYFLILFSIFNIYPALSAQLLSHKATYTLNIQSIKDNSFLEGGQGQTFFEIIENCNGWNIKEDYVLIYELPNNKTSNSFSSYSTFENFLGTKHSFELNEESQFSGKKSYQGFIEKNKREISGSIINNSIKKLTFKKDILFPIEHLLELIKTAKIGKKILTKKVFFGNEDEEFIKIVSAFIGQIRNSTLEDIEYLKGKKIWPIKVAFYKEKSKQENPEYEIYLEIDDLGVVHSYKVDYGSFEIEALLKKFELLPKAICKKYMLLQQLVQYVLDT